jgi:putative SOS response-associated peptidase YedK
MCYDLAYLTRRSEKYIERYEREQEVLNIQKKLTPTFHTNGFDHIDLPVITNDAPEKIQAFQWGLIPWWVKDVQACKKISNTTLNARGEEMFEKNSFKNSALKQRCLIIVDGFFDHHWKGKNSFPYFVSMKNEEPFSLAGLWETWHLKEEGITRNTVSIVTSAANKLMTHIHNKPKGSEGPRMPLIIPKELEEAWLKPVEDPVDKQAILELVKPYEDENLKAYTVPKLRGKAYIGNIPEIITQHLYEELNASPELF